MWYYVFLSIGIILVLLSICFKFWWRVDFCYELFLNLGISVLAVTVVEFLWKRVGGDPISKAIDRLRIATQLLRDLEHTGIERVYTERQDSDARDWHRKVTTAKEVDLMSICLSRDWLLRPELREAIENAAREQRTYFRILILDPTSEVAAQRAREEGKKEFLPTIEQSLKTLQAMREHIGPTVANTHFKLRVINRTNIYCRIVRADDMMLVTKYLCHCSGSTSPTLEIHGKDTPWFQKFKNEFDHMWEQGADCPSDTTALSTGGDS